MEIALLLKPHILTQKYDSFQPSAKFRTFVVKLNTYIAFDAFIPLHLIFSVDPTEILAEKNNSLWKTEQWFPSGAKGFDLVDWCSMLNLLQTVCVFLVEAFIGASAVRPKRRRVGGAVEIVAVDRPSDCQQIRGDCQTSRDWLTAGISN